jgi:lipoprotein-anchoring transpeptidase ErfK/SrfK
MNRNSSTQRPPRCGHPSILVLAGLALFAASPFTAAAGARELGSRAASGSSEARVSSVYAAQTRLASLGYLPRADVDGVAGPVTQSAVVAFQKWQGLPRSGHIDGATMSALSTAHRPRPVKSDTAGRSIEVLLDRQVLLAVQNGRVVRTIDVSTGKPSTPTPTGSFTVYGKYPRWWSQPFGEWLLWAAPFNGGIAMHEFASVPAHAASHGCVRVKATDAHWLYDFVSVGTPVDVLARSN